MGNEERQILFEKTPLFFWRELAKKNCDEKYQSTPLNLFEFHHLVQKD